MNATVQNGGTDCSRRAGRVIVDLSLFFNDYKKFCIIYLDYDKFKTIEDLKEYIVNTFDIKKRCILMLNNCLLLEKETAKVLQNEDVIWLADPDNFDHSVEVSASLKSPESKIKEKEHFAAACNGEKIDEETSEDELDGQRSKRKQRPAEAASSKQKKARLSTTETIGIEESSDDEEESLKSAVSSGVKSGISMAPFTFKMAESEVRQGVENAEVEFDWSCAPVPKRKRVRKRRSKKQQSSKCETNGLTAEETAPTPLVLPPKIRQEGSRVHIRFDAEATVTPAVVDSPLVKTSAEKSSSPGANTDESPVIELLKMKKPVVFERNLKSKVPPPKDWSNVTESQIWACPAVTEKPMPDEIVAFKVLHVGENYTPELSSWIIARVTSKKLEEEDKIDLEIQRGCNPRYRAIGGKFDIDDGEEEQEFTMKMAWKELVTPRNISSLK